MLKLGGKWKYWSYRSDPSSVPADPKLTTIIRWSPNGVATIDRDETTGKSGFTETPINLDLKIQISDGSPGSLSISEAIKLAVEKQFTNELQGRFVPTTLGQQVSKDDPRVVGGCIVPTSSDIAPTDPQPISTTGFFILEQMQ